MPYNQILIGLTPDDGTGDTNRNAWTKTDAMLAEVFTRLDNSLDLATYTNDMVAQAIAIASLTTQVAGKADASVLQGYPMFAQVVRIDIPQALLLTAKRQGVSNGGHYVTLPFEILAPGIDIDGGGGSWQWDLPRFPQDFTVVDAFLAATELTGTIDPGDFTLVASLVDGVTPTIGRCIGTNMDAAGITPMDIVNSESLIAKGRGIQLNVVVTKVDAYAGTAQGMTLWLRGVWKS